MAKVLHFLDDVVNMSFEGTQVHEGNFVVGFVFFLVIQGHCRRRRFGWRLLLAVWCAAKSDFEFACCLLPICSFFVSTLLVRAARWETTPFPDPGEEQTARSTEKNGEESPPAAEAGGGGKHSLAATLPQPQRITATTSWL